MYGLILSGFSSYLIHKYGEDAWDNIRRLANIDNATFTVHQVYPEQLLGRVSKKAFSTLGNGIRSSDHKYFSCSNFSSRAILYSKRNKDTHSITEFKDLLSLLKFQSDL